MGRKKIPTPEKYCEYCGKKLERKVRPDGWLEPIYWFSRRKYCDVYCAGKASSICRLSKDTTSPKTSRQRARHMLPQSSCELCGKNGYTEVHHKDKNPLNNDPSNLMRLCKSCHRKQHAVKEKCIICGEPMKGHGLCSKHWQAWRKSIKRGFDTPYTLSIKKAMSECQRC